MPFLDNFWNEKFWLPENITWSHIEPGMRDGVEFRNYNDLLWSLPLALLLSLVRLTVTRFCFVPLGKSLNIKSTKIQPPFESATLEKSYAESSKLSTQTIGKLVKQTDFSEREIERWWRKRRAQDKPSLLDKFCENCWRFAFYAFNFVFGLCILWNKPWLWNFFDVFRNYPFHSIDNGLWWYNNVTVAFYLSLSLSHFFEARRKDFWQMFIHHLITLTLFIVSWIVNAIRGSSLVNFVHDIADVLLEAGKATNYAKYEKTCSVIFSLFSLVWIVTRLGVFSRIVYVGVTQFPTIHPKYPMYYIFTVLNISLLVLHIIWTYMIYKVAVRMFKTSAVSDVRSSSEESESDGEEEEKKLAINGNGKANIHHANGHVH